MPKISLNQFLISVLPGGFVISIVLLTMIYYQPTLAGSIQDLDFLMSFAFISLSFVCGEILQALARIAEKIIDWLFFKGYRPSQVFLLLGNPVLSDTTVRKNLIKKIKIGKNAHSSLPDYKSISWIKRQERETKDLNHRCFWEIYTKCRTEEHIQTTNARYLFTRVMFVVFLFSAVWFFWFGMCNLSALSVVFLLIFLWRARGCAKGLVFSSVNEYLK